MMNKKSRQPFKFLAHKASGAIGICLFLLILLFFLSFTIRNIIIYNHIKSGNLLEYSGTYAIKEHHNSKNTTYFVFLENGDTLRIYPELLNSQDELLDLAPLRFIYSEPKYGLKSMYMCVGISSVNNTECYLELQSSARESLTGIYIGGLLLVCLLVPVVFVIVLRFAIRRI